MSLQTTVAYMISCPVCSNVHETQSDAAACWSSTGMQVTACVNCGTGFWAKNQDLCPSLLGTVATMKAVDDSVDAIVEAGARALVAQLDREIMAALLPGILPDAMAPCGKFWYLSKARAELDMQRLAPQRGEGFILNAYAWPGRHPARPAQAYRSADTRSAAVSIPRATPDRIAYAQFATRGVLTRLALMFQSNAEKAFTGSQVAETLVAACISIGRPGEAPQLEEAGTALCENSEVGRDKS